MDYVIIPSESKTKGTRYRVRLPLHVNGKQVWVPGGTHDTRKAAERAGEKLRLQHEPNEARRAVLLGNTLFSDYAPTWLAGLTQKETTKATYRWRMNNWVLPYFKETKVKDLSFRQIDAWVNGPDLARLSPRCRYQALSCLKLSLQGAIRQGMIASNPAQGIPVDQTKAQKKGAGAKKRAKTWGYADAGKLLDASQGLPVEPLIVLGMLCGLRPGEVVALRWTDIDFGNNSVTVSKTTSRAGSQQFAMDETKTGEVRTVQLLADSAFRLARIQEARGEVEGPQGEPSDARVYPAENITPWKHVTSLCKAAGVAILPPHSLRHTCASILLANGGGAAALPKVARQLGHSTPRTTMSTYWHLLPDEKDDLSEAMSRGLNQEFVPKESRIS